MISYDLPENPTRSRLPLGDVLLKEFLGDVFELPDRAGGLAFGDRISAAGDVAQHRHSGVSGLVWRQRAVEAQAHPPRLPSPLILDDVGLLPGRQSHADRIRRVDLSQRISRLPGRGGFKASTLRFVIEPFMISSSNSA